MATNPDEIRLTEDYRKRLAKIADQTGTSWQALLERALTHMEQTPLRSEQEAAREPAPIFDEDTEYLALCLAELRELEAEQAGAEKPTIEDAWRILAKVPGSMVDDIHEDRGDR